MAGPTTSKPGNPQGHTGLESTTYGDASRDVAVPGVLFCNNVKCTANNGTPGKCQPASLPSVLQPSPSQALAVPTRINSDQPFCSFGAPAPQSSPGYVAGYLQERSIR